MITDVARPRAILLTNGFLSQPDAKTAHGLIRGTDRYEIVGVIDNEHAGRDAGEVLDGINRNIPVFVSVDEAVTKLPLIQYCIIGVATIGGVLPEHFKPILQALSLIHI